MGEFAKITPVHYNEIPSYCFVKGGSILDIGCMSGLNALISKHRNHFLQAETNGKYLGVELLEYPKNYLAPIVIDDVQNFSTDQSFDLVLALHVMEHIDLASWDHVILKLKRVVKAGGYLVVDVPYKSKDTNPYIEGQDHVVFDIDDSLIRGYLPDAEIFKYRRKYSHFRKEGESLVWAICRLFWRTITRHEYRFRLKDCIVAVWKNQEGRE